MQQTIRPARGLLGVVELPADKSIAHRTALFAALGDGVSHLVNYPASADPQSTLSCLRQLGVRIEASETGYTVHGVGLTGFSKPSGPLDCGNSGTTMRMLCGILAGQPFDSELIGDASLSGRPMERVAGPLRQMGAKIDLTDGHAPVRIHGGQRLKGMVYRLPMPSAQVKSCVLLAGLYAEGETTVIETLPSRDHTERMLQLDAVEMNGERHLTVRHGRRIPRQAWAVPKDFSASAFFLVAGSVVPGAELRLPGVGINSSRSALLDVLRAMGASITMSEERTYGGEPIADLLVRSSSLHGVTVPEEFIANLIDEIPILCVAATQAKGRTEIRNAGELRVKETDRIAAMVKNLRAFGAEVEEFEDGLAITGGKPLHGAEVESFHDHRIAMAMGVAGLVAAGKTVVQGAEIASVSFPTFWDQLKSIAS